MANESDGRKPTDDAARPQADELSEESLENVSGGTLSSNAGKSKVQVIILQPSTSLAQVTPVMPGSRTVKRQG